MINFTKGFKGALALFMIGMTAVGATAADLITAPMIVNPANGSMGAMFGQVNIHWTGVTLEMENRDKDAEPADYNYIDPSYLSISVNGEDVTIDNTQMGGRIFTKVVQESNEQNGGQEGASMDVLYVDFPASFPNPYFTWKGEINVNIKEGAVTTTTGEVNGNINLTYYFVEAASDVTWEPAQESKFVAGNCIVTASWAEGNVTGLIDSKAPFLQMEDAANNNQNGSQIPASQYAKIVDGNLQFDFSSLSAGKYSLTLPEGCVMINEEYINSETYYNFTVSGNVIVPEPTVKVLPNENDWFDAFSLTWGQVNAPYTLSSPYTDSDGSINSEGLKLIKVKENGLDELEILDASFVEYQEGEDTPNYPSAQFYITLADIQMNVGSLYTLNIEPGLLNININGSEVPNDAVTFSFTLKAGSVFELPEPNVSPESGTLETLEVIEISWDATLGGLDLLNVNEDVDPITVTVDGETFDDFTTKFEWSSRNAVTEGAAGDIFTILFDDAPEGEYIVTIPEGYFQVSDVEKGSYDSQEIILTYNVIQASDENPENPENPGNPDEPDNSGVAGIEADSNGSYGVYRLNGQKVLETNNASDIKNLDKGLYIINGQKVIVK